MIAVTFALPTESSAFVRLLENRTSGAMDSRIVSGSLNGRAVSLLHTGVGEKTTRTRMADFFRTQQPRLLISAGFAGALDQRLGVGDVFVGENFSDAELARQSKWPRVILATIPRVIETLREREFFARESGAAAVDMETEWIAEACRAAAVPLFSLRVISDSPTDPLPAPARVLFDLERQRTPALKLIGHLVRHPAAVPSLLRFARRVDALRQKLTDALVEVCASLPD